MRESVMKRRSMIDMEEFERRLRQNSGSKTDDGPVAEFAHAKCGQNASVQAAEPQGQSTPKAQQAPGLSSKVQEPEAQKPDELQTSCSDKIACQDSGAVKIASPRSLYNMIVAAIIIVGTLGVGTSIRYKNGTSLPPEIAAISDNGPARQELEKTNRSNVPTPDTSVLGRTPQPSPKAVAIVPSQPRETIPAAEIAASPEQIGTQVQPPGQTASIEPEKMNTASVEQRDAISSGTPPRAQPKMVPVPVPRPAALAKVPAPKMAAKVKAANTAEPQRPESTVRAQPVPVTSTTQKRGWVNFGTFKNGNWVEKQFEISGAPMRPPRPGDTLTATIPVNVRQGPIEETKEFGWQNQAVACDPTYVGEKFTVLRTVEIVPGYFWAEIKNSVHCAK